MTKICTKCGVEKAFSEYHKDKSNKDKLQSRCKTCRSLQKRQYREKNKEKIAEYHRQWYEENKEKRKEQMRQWCKDNKERKAEYDRQYNKEWYKKNKEKIASYSVEYQRKHKEKISEYKKQYYEKNRGAFSLKNAKYYQNNKEKVLECNRQWRKNNPEKAKEYQLQYLKKMTAGIYKITNKQTGIIYIGCSTQLKRRFRDHKNHLKKNKHFNAFLQEAYNQCGLDVFEFEVIKEYPADTPLEVLVKEEERAIWEAVTNGKRVYNDKIKNLQHLY